MSYDDWLRDKVAFGTAEMVTAQLSQLQQELGLTRIIYEINYGNLLSWDLQVNSLRRFHQQVVPNFSPE